MDKYKTYRECFPFIDTVMYVHIQTTVRFKTHYSMYIIHVRAQLLQHVVLLTTIAD